MQHIPNLLLAADMSLNTPRVQIKLSTVLVQKFIFQSTLFAVEEKKSLANILSAFCVFDPDQVTSVFFTKFPKIEKNYYYFD